MHRYNGSYFKGLYQMTPTVTEVVSMLAPSERRVSVVVPAFNEGEEIGRTLARIYAAVDPMRERYAVDVIVVDDGSSDETASTIMKFASERPDLIIRTHAVNRGLVEGLKTGATASTAEVIVYLDADLSYTPDIVEPLVATLFARDAAVVIASPYMSGGRVGNVPRDRLIASRGANWLLARCVGGRVKTFTGMVRAYRAEVLREIMTQKTHGEFNAWVVAELLRRRATIVEIPAALVWPDTRSKAPSRMTLRKLWNRLALVLVTASELARAAAFARKPSK
ncbi:MAG: glycosyltransferase [Vulcanimicrobiaceae bacterium]